MEEGREKRMPAEEAQHNIGTETRGGESREGAHAKPAPTLGLKPHADTPGGRSGGCNMEHRLDSGETLTDEDIERECAEYETGTWEGGTHGYHVSFERDASANDAHRGNERDSKSHVLASGRVVTDDEL